MKKIIIALLLVAIPVMALAANFTISDKTQFNIGPKRACVATLSVASGDAIYDDGYGLTKRSLGLENVDYWSIQPKAASYSGWIPLWVHASGYVEFYYYDAADTTGSITEADSATTLHTYEWDIFAIGN